MFNENNILEAWSLSLSLFCISVCISDLVFLNGQTLQKADGRRDLEDITGKQLIWPGTRKTLIRPAERARKGWFFRFGSEKADFLGLAKKADFLGLATTSFAVGCIFSLMTVFGAIWHVIALRKSFKRLRLQKSYDFEQVCQFFDFLLTGSRILVWDTAQEIVWNLSCWLMMER